jgi:hypothetical protein
VPLTEIIGGLSSTSLTPGKVVVVVVYVRTCVSEGTDL